jgi:hypothetical protein
MLIYGDRILALYSGIHTWRCTDVKSQSTVI